EDDGRIFPEADSSQTIIDCFLEEATQLQIKIIKQTIDQKIEKSENGWMIATSKDTCSCQQLVMATGSNIKDWDLLITVRHSIVKAVASLFTFMVKGERIDDLMAVSAAMVSIKVKDTQLNAAGPLLLIHWGMSGPAILRVSA